MASIKILGGSREKGRSCYLLELDNKKILLDCGVKKTITKDIVGEAPFLDEIEADKIDMVFLSHAHEDHCVYLPYLYKKGYKGKVYCTKPTKDLVPQYIDTWFKVIEKNNGTYPYEKEFVKDVDFEILNYNEPLEIDNLKITLFPAGHMLGAAMPFIEGSKRVLFTGDFSFDNRVLKEPSCDIESDVIICDGNHGLEVIDKIEEEEILMNFLDKTLKDGNVLIPIAPFGRLQEILTLLQEKNFKFPIILDSSLEKAYQKYDEYSSWLSKNWCSWTDLSRKLDVRSYNIPQEALEQLSKNKEHALILASNAMLTGGLSKEYLKYMENDQKNGIVMNGHQDKTSLGYKLLSDEHKVAIQRIFLNLKVHPDGNDIKKMIKNLPEEAKIILVHSTLEKAEEIKNGISERNILIPEIMNEIEI